MDPEFKLRIVRAIDSGGRSRGYATLAKAYHQSGLASKNTPIGKVRDALSELIDEGRVIMKKFDGPRGETIERFYLTEKAYGVYPAAAPPPKPKPYKGLMTWAPIFN